ncbi:MAG: RluA family pseudouridine synthase [Akkermansiaceae bacterium]
MSPLPLDIIHTDPDFIVVNKPSGLLSVPGRALDNKDSVVNRVKAMFADVIQHPEVHRLDMDTSGIMVVALTAEAHRNLSIQFQDRYVSKRYEALLEGVPESDGGVIELPFRLDVENRPIQIYDEVHGKMGKTVWEKVEVVSTESGDCARVSFVPVTGRTHQLRLHASHEKGIGIPIVGDPFYGNGVRAGEMLLHACELCFTHPRTGKMLKFVSNPPF